MFDRTSDFVVLRRPSAIQLILTASISSCHRRCSTKYSTVYHTLLTGVSPSAVTVLARVTLDSDDISSSREAVVIVLGGKCCDEADTVLH